MARLYLLIIAVVLVILIALNSFLASLIYGVTANVLISTILQAFAIVVIIDAFFAILIGIMPKKWFGINSKLLNVSKKEQRLYEKMHIRKWKDYVWDLGGLGGFSKQKIQDDKDPRYFERFIVESNRGVVEHSLGIVFGFCILFIFPKYIWSICLPIALVNLFLNTMSTLVLRYNLPKLKAVYTMLLRKQSRSVSALNSSQNSDIETISNDNEYQDA